MVAHLDAVTSLAVDPNGLYLLSGSKILYFWQAVLPFLYGLGSVLASQRDLKTQLYYYGSSGRIYKHRIFVFVWTGNSLKTMTSR